MSVNALAASAIITDAGHNPAPAPDPFDFDAALQAARLTALRTLHRIANSLDAPLVDSSHHDIREARLASLAILRTKPDREPLAGTPSQMKCAGVGPVVASHPAQRNTTADHSPFLREGAPSPAPRGRGAEAPRGGEGLRGLGGREPAASEPRPTNHTPTPDAPREQVHERPAASPPPLAQPSPLGPHFPLPRSDFRLSSPHFPRGKDLLDVVGSTRSRAPDHRTANAATVHSTRAHHPTSYAA